MPNEKSNETTEKKFKIPYKILVPAAVAVILVLVTIITAFALNTGDNIKGGVSINGYPVGNMSKEEAATLVESTTGTIATDKILTVSYEDETKQIATGELVLGYDIEGAVSSAFAAGRSGNAIVDFFDSVGIKFAGRNIIVQPLLDEAYVSQLMESFDILTKDPLKPNVCRIENGRLRLQHGTAGYVMQTEKAKNDITAAIIAGENATIAIAKEYVEPGEFDIEKIYDEFCVPPVNAKYEIRDGIGYFEAAKNGYNFKKEDLKKLIEENKENKEAFYLDVEVLNPEKTYVEAEGLFPEVIAEYTSKITDSNANRLTNVRLAAEKINGSILNPGEVFYYLNHVEPITTANGYKIANVYSNGKVEQDIGGGVCQVSSTLYSAALEADLEIVKRYNHSLTVGYVPLGQDATVASGEIDLRFRNNTKAPIKIVSSFTTSGVTVKILGQKLIPGRTIEIENITVETIHAQTVETEDPTLKPGEKVADTNPKTGYVVDTYKKIYQDGVFVERQYVSRSVYRAVNKQVRVGPQAESEEELPVSGEIPPAETPSPEETPEITPIPEPSPTPEQPIPVPEPVPTPTPEIM